MFDELAMVPAVGGQDASNRRAGLVDAKHTITSLLAESSHIIDLNDLAEANESHQLQPSTKIEAFVSDAA